MEPPITDSERRAARAETSPDWVRDTVFYAIDVARFRDSDGDGFGDLPGLIEKFDYLEELGVGCLWFLPFYPSARRDNGYDVTDYYGVDPRMGTLEDFQRLTTEAHARGIRVMVDLVAHHTSEKHPWFEAARADRGSRFHDYYVWSYEEPTTSPEESVFPEEERGIWSYSRHADAWYRHRFYSFQPDLRIANDAVWASILGVVDFWIAMGVDAFRIDAATHLFEDKGVEGGTARLDERMDALRSYLAERAPGVALVGEADVATSAIPPYFERGRFDSLYNFLANNTLFLSLARESAEPLGECLAGLHDEVPDGTWLNFVRNLDELDLEQLRPEDRAEVRDHFAPDDDMRIYGRGIRRGWAPMMRGEAQLRMTMSLLFAPPGAPLLAYGHEIGIGENLAAEGRKAVRIPMQWSAERHGGFTREGRSGITDAAQPRGRYGYRRRNVEAQRGDPQSLLTLTRELISLRRDHPSIGGSPWQLRAEGPLLWLAYGPLTAVHNLSRRHQRVEAVESQRRLLGDDLSAGRIPGYGLCWFMAE
ncbi:alpha-amylase family glycosyl hydrolase [Salinibacterium sp. SYSU T00001]|uniref:alpha-amylase family glycosyl hydrolase n=1 Tax=Homoserinimonas sedimenticola TaxID=2986805 RepID=UPI002235D5B1|nr:alpha-amylase family glycosyl hydrolase [Salinibacterium sedimenticola]MCW4385873.1 alpha-amylase family glycosyl hydrolase [Salinibacterium sedimenticola]